MGALTAAVSACGLAHALCFFAMSLRGILSNWAIWVCIPVVLNFDTCTSASSCLLAPQYKAPSAVLLPVAAYSSLRHVLHSTRQLSLLTPANNANTYVYIGMHQSTIHISSQEVGSLHTADTCCCTTIFIQCAVRIRYASPNVTAFSPELMCDQRAQAFTIQNFCKENKPGGNNRLLLSIVNILRCTALVASASGIPMLTGS